MGVKQNQRAELSTFIRGLITEATPLNFPEDATRDEVNFELLRNGSRRRRLGMDYEVDNTFITTQSSYSDLDNFGINTFKWSEVNGVSDQEFLVVQIGRTLFFFKLFVDNISRDGYLGFISIPAFPNDIQYGFASCEGSLVVVAGVSPFAIITYNGLAFSLTYDRLKIRDVFGIQSIDQRFETDPNFRGPLEQYHYYNLMNQSWAFPRWQWLRWGNSLTDAVVQAGAPAQAPSNSDTVWMGMEYRTVGDEPPDDSGGAPSVEAFSPQQYRGIEGANPLAPKGFFIIDALQRGASRKDAWTNLRTKYPQVGGALGGGFTPVTDSTSGGATCVAEFSGRIFFSGFQGTVTGGDIRSPNYNNFVFFSQLIKNKSDISKCYQEGDPTSRESSDIVDTDGGFIKISEASTIIAMFPLESSLIVIATNGVWRVVGGSDYGFSASNYRVDKISTFGGISPSSIVIEGSRALYWSNDGIYAIGKNELGDLLAENITANTIQSYYQDIPIDSKRNCIGIYDIYAKRARWVFRDNDSLLESSKFKELIFDLNLKAFFPFELGNMGPNTPRVVGLFQSTPYRLGDIDEDVIIDTDNLVMVNTDQVFVRTNSRLTGFASVKYLTLVNVNGNLQFTFSLYRNTSFKDWVEYNGIGVDAKAYFLTGSQTVGDSAIDKQTPYLIAHFYNTERVLNSDYTVDVPSSCMARFQWDFSDDIKSNRWSKLMQLFRPRQRYIPASTGTNFYSGFEVITTKTKIRGQGRAFSLYVETEPGKDCQLFGWNLTVNGNSST